MIQTMPKKKGQSLIEVLIAVSVGTVMITAAAAVIVPALRVSTQTKRAQTGAALAKGLLENVRVWSEGDWHRISNLATSSAHHYYLNTTSSPFAFSFGDQSILVSTTTYTRYFYVDDVYRDGNDAIMASGGSFDPSTKKVTVLYSWAQSSIYAVSQYITRHRNSAFFQTDWSNGPGQDGPITAVNGKFSTSSVLLNYSSTTGSLILNL